MTLLILGGKDYFTNGFMRFMYGAFQYLEIASLLVSNDLYPNSSYVHPPPVRPPYPNVLYRTRHASSQPTRPARFLLTG